MTSETTCLLCGGGAFRLLCDAVEDYEYGAPGVYRWLECAGCRLVRLDPFPPPAVLAAAYPPDYHAFVEPGSRLLHGLRRASERRIARRLVRGLPDGAAVLDVGCSTGALLGAIGELGPYRLHGVELDAEAAAAARRRGIEVREGELESAGLPAESMDLVTLQHLIEHVADPLATLSEARRVLRPGGRIAGELPNLASWDAALFGRFWGGGHAPRHLWFFTPETLRRSLERAGFDAVEVTPSLHTGHWALSVQNWLSRRGAGGRLVAGRAWYFPLLLLAAVPVNLLQMPLLRTGVMRFSARRAA